MPSDLDRPRKLAMRLLVAHAGSIRAQFKTETSALRRLISTRSGSSVKMSESVLKGVQLVNAKGETIEGDDVAKSGALAFYFAADWCPDCRGFQPTLNKFYERVNAESKRLELVFVSSDGSQEAQATHLKDKQGPWWSVPFESPLRNELKRKYAVAAGKELVEVGLTARKAGIPGLVVVQPNGDVIKLFDDSELAGDGLKELEQLL